MTNHPCLYLGTVPNVSIMSMADGVPNADGSISSSRRGEHGESF